LRAENSTNLSAEFFAGKEQFMLSVFADDSSDETQQRTVAVAGVIASDEEWNRLDRIWLERTGGIPFHATDCESDRGAYGGYCHLDNQNLYKDHVSVQTTEKYLGCKQRLREAVNDKIGIEPVFT
jgi:hypothetical protein